MTLVSPTSSPTISFNDYPTDIEVDIYTTHFNLLCEPSIHWTLPTIMDWTINHNLCEITVISTSFIMYLDINMATIFSDESKYPLNFAFSATAYNKSTTIGGSFHFANTEFACRG